MHVVAIETKTNRVVGTYSGFYGNEALNQKRRKIGESFVINDTETTKEEKADREAQIKKRVVEFHAEGDREAYLKLQDFAPWMTTDRTYKPAVPKRNEPGKVRTADSPDSFAPTGDDGAPAPEPLPDGGHEGDFETKSGSAVMTKVKKMKRVN
jgi:hypothetical protein